MNRGVVAAALVLGLSGLAARATAQDPADWWTLRSSIKSTALLSHLPDDVALFPDRNSAEGLWRVRLEPTVRVGDAASVEFAVEQRVRAFTAAAGLARVVPDEGRAPFRIRQLDWELAASPNAGWRLEIDRAAVHATAGRLTLTAGRQAIGWGRGVLFGAVDLFSPFAPLEADREWRRGVDAVRADVALADRVSIDTVAAFGEDIDHSAFAARLRGYAGEADVEVVGGRRARDTFLGATTSVAAGPAELHAELAVFDTPDDGVVTKAVGGGSYRLPIRNGILLFVEYHYSGFGAASPQQIVTRLAAPSFQERYLRGDTQILGRHALAALASYEWSPEWTGALQWLQSPADGSGVFVPSATLTLGDRVSLLSSVYVPYGRSPAGPVLRSEYGAAPLAALLQLRFYR